MQYQHFACLCELCLHANRMKLQINSKYLGHLKFKITLQVREPYPKRIFLIE